MPRFVHVPFDTPVYGTSNFIFFNTHHSHSREVTQHWLFSIPYDCIDMVHTHTSTYLITVGGYSRGIRQFSNAADFTSGADNTNNLANTRLLASRNHSSGRWHCDTFSDLGNANSTGHAKHKLATALGGDNISSRTVKKAMQVWRRYLTVEARGCEIFNK